MPDEKDKVDTTKRGYRDELRKRAVKKAMAPKEEAKLQASVTIKDITDGIRRIEEYFEGAAQETLG
tara:strand:+ start:718 stop:915 length:198 start_codon:yes stop_codon:yes gene_type:complete